MKVVSCFAGIGGFDLGFERSGFEVVAVVEKDAKCRKLLAKRFPNAKQFDDVATVGNHNLPHDVFAVFGGFPCQGLSVSGLRAGLRDARSGLFYELTRITHELQPAFLVWENVPGLLSSDSGRDFARVLIELDRIGYHGAWRTLNAQHFGVAQRRRRVFGVFARGDIGAERCGEILSLAEGMRWNPPPSRAKKEDITGTFTRSSLGGGSAAGGEGKDAFLVSPTLQASGAGVARTGGQGAESGFFVEDLAPTLKAEGADAGTDGRQHALIADVAPGLNDVGGHSRPGDGLQSIGFLIPEIAHALTSRNERNEPTTETLIISEAEDEGLPFAASDYKTGKFESAETARSLTTSADRSRAAPIVAFSTNQRGEAREREVAGSLTGGSGKQIDGVLARRRIRRIRRMTPTECERIMGFPDDWTEGFADGPRYKMLGNAVVVACSEWFARRMKKIAGEPLWNPRPPMTSTPPSLPTAQSLR